MTANQCVYRLGVSGPASRLQLRVASMLDWLHDVEQPRASQTKSSTRHVAYEMHISKLACVAKDVWLETGL